MVVKTAALLMLLSPARAGESHMDLRPVLHWSARWILRTTPTERRESDGQVQKVLWSDGRPACGQCPPRPSGAVGYRSGGDPVWGGELLGHGRLRPGEG